MGTPFSGRAIHFGQPATMIGDDILMLGQRCQVRPFVGVGLQVVQLFAAVGVTDISPTLAARQIVQLDSRQPDIYRGKRDEENCIHLWTVAVCGIG